MKRLEIKAERDYDVMCMLDENDAYQIGAEKSANGGSAIDTTFRVDYDPEIAFAEDDGWTAAFDAEVAAKEVDWISAYMVRNDARTQT